MMNVSWQSNIFIAGLSLSFICGITYFLGFESKVMEYRMTYSVSSDDYQQYRDKLTPFVSEKKEYSISLSPNFESIADTLINQHIRRFELREFHVGSLKKKEGVIQRIYFNKVNDLKQPVLITDRFVSSNRPLKTSLGIFVLILSLTLFVETLVTVKY